ncbi:hypothetical protein F5878DRAFT_419987 [Lentinula raphanica]|uniref:DH domain-containing protein n=1 Tax=Lentinula raphanica TaxID=153919 RepID=A0AA38PGJ5_9AGAR|nr:hypothetical protein F5878DRAFT_419987 [Lentinula raphanica]
MALVNSPRKQIPLATGDEARPRDFAPTSSFNRTKRVFFCGVVVEGSENGKDLSEEIKELVLSLGDPVEEEDGLLEETNKHSGKTEIPVSRKRALTESSALASAINELVTTERSYVKKLQILKKDYADPLRNFARSKSTAIISKYEATTLFGNIDSLLPVNEAFLTDLEKMVAPNGYRAVGGIGDVALRHFKELKGFEQYKQYYVKREEAQRFIEQEMEKRSSPFEDYIERVKYQSTDVRNRVGLRELLMEPVQRIPRYTLLFRLMIKHMPPGDPQRAKLEEADEIASKIALAEADEQTKRAAIVYCLIATIDGFPPNMFSNSRRFIDCIDVEDILLEAPASSSASSTSLVGSLHCTLFLFDDKLLIVKRPGNGEKSGRVLAGLDDLDRLTKGGLPTGKKKHGMVCKGVFDVTDVVATDQDGADFHLYLENPPQDHSERWAGRPFRSYSVVHPPSPVNLDPSQTEADKQRFLNNLWNVQAKYRARSGQSVVLCSNEMEVESRGGKVTTARTYYNVYQRTAFLQEPKKTKIVVHVDALGTADDIPFGIRGPPYAVIRLQPLAGGMCRYKVTSSDPSDPEEVDVVQTGRVPQRIVLTIHQFGVFQFKTDKNSRPSTPTARSKASIFGLDAISRNLFNARPGSSMGDFFAGSVSSRKRTKSTASRSSTYTQTTSTGDSSITKFSSSRSNTISTVATTVDDGSLASSRSRKKHDRGRSPGPSSDAESSFSQSLTRSLSRSLSRASKSRSLSRDTDSDYTDIDDDDEQMQDIDRSDLDIDLQLALARKNSKSQNDRQVPMRSSQPSTVPIYEEDYPYNGRPPSRASTARDSNSQCTITEDPRSPRSLSRHSSDRRPMGPRSPSPLPPPKSPRPPSPPLPEPPSIEDEITAEIDEIVQPTPTKSGIPRSKRQIFQPMNGESTPKPYTNGMARASSSVEPLSIKKKTSVRSTSDFPDTPVTGRKSGRTSLSRTPARTVTASPRRVSPQIRFGKVAGPSVSSPHIVNDLDKIISIARTTKEDVESSHRAVKRLKVEVERHNAASMPSDNDISRPSSPSKGLRTPQRVAPPPLTKAAQERLEEMRSLIGQRTGESTPRSHRTTGMTTGGTPLRQHSSMDSPGIFNTPIQASQSASTSGLDRLIAEADVSLAKAVGNHEAMQTSLGKLSSALKERTNDLERSKIELQNSRRQCEVVKSLLDEATKEKEIMYEAFNEELDAMYNDVNLPEDEAWQTMTEDLRVTKEARNKLTQENCELKQRLAEAELRQEEWGALLRAHGLIS